MSHNIIAPTAEFFISHKLAVVNSRHQVQHMNNRSYVIEQTTALHLIYQKFNYLHRSTHLTLSLDKARLAERLGA